MTLLTGVAYPLARHRRRSSRVFPHQANGSLITKDGKDVGSELIGQPFDEPKYFWSRLVRDEPRIQRGRLAPVEPRPAEPRLGTPSRPASRRSAPPIRRTPRQSRSTSSRLRAAGSIPHISPAAAEYQVARVAKARGMDPGKVRELVQASTIGRGLVVLGEPAVNVLELNLALDRAR